MFKIIFEIGMDEASEEKLDAILRSLKRIEKTGGKIMFNVDDIAAKVAEQETVIGSTVTLLTELRTELRNAGTDPAKLNAIGLALDAHTQMLAEAVAAKTVAADEVPPAASTDTVPA